MSIDPSPAELWWRVSWLAGTAVPRTAGATWTPPAPPAPESVRTLQEVGVTAEEFANGLVRVFGASAAVPPPEPDPAWLQAPTLAELDPAPARRTGSRLRESIRVELHREAQRVYVAAQQEMRRQCRLCARELEHHRHAV